MNDDQTSEKSSCRVAWVIACLVLLLASVVLLKRSTQRGAVIVTLDTNGTTRFAGVLPLQKLQHWTQWRCLSRVTNTPKRL